MSNLVLHCGAEAIDRASLMSLPAPVPMGPRHYPVHHGDLVTMVDDTLGQLGLAINDESFGTTKDGARFFGVMEVSGKAVARGDGYGVALGLRASYDQSMAESFAIGSRVFVCDNLAFSGERVLKTKHTTNILDRLPVLLYSLIRGVMSLSEQQAEQLEGYKGARLTSRQADSAIVDMLRRGIVTATDMPQLVREWDEPSHEEFAEEPTVWRLFNAATETLKPARGQANIVRLMDRTPKLHQLCDELSLAA